MTYMNGPITMQGANGWAKLWEDAVRGGYVVVIRQLVDGAVSNLPQSRVEKRYADFFTALRQAARWADSGTLIE